MKTAIHILIGVIVILAFAAVSATVLLMILSLFLNIVNKESMIEILADTTIIVVGSWGLYQAFERLLALSSISPKPITK